MPKSSYADFVQGYRYLLGAVVDNAADLPEADRLRLALQQKVDALDAEKLAQLAAQGEGRVRTQTVRRLQSEADDLVRRLQSLVKFSVGPRDERLSMFGVAPLRKRGRRRIKPVEVPPPKAGPETATPATAGPPGPEPPSSSSN